MGIRTYRNVPRVYFDMDDTLYDYSGYAGAKGVHPREIRLWPGVYASLKPLAGAREAVQEVLARGFDAFVLTKISKDNPYAASEKIVALYRDFPEFNDHIIISPDKGAVGLPRDYLIDDKPHWANADRFPGTVLAFDGDWSAVLNRLPAVAAGAQEALNA